jgi:phage tail P2-like protein
MDLRDVSILKIMPPNLAADRNVRMIAEAFDEVLRDIIKKVPNVAVIPNLVLNQIVEEMIIDLLAWQFHVDFYEPDLPIETKRNLVLKSLDWHYRKGTPSVVEEIVSTVFSRAQVQEWFEYNGLPYRFRIATEETPQNAEAVKKLMRAINSVKNTRSYLDALTYLVDFSDEVIIDEILEIKGRMQFIDVFKFAKIKYNGNATYNGNYKYGKGIQDELKIKANAGNYLDFFTAALTYSGMIKADGSHKYKRATKISDSFSIRIRYHRKYNGAYKSNGAIQFNTGIFIPA